jgi:phospholipid-binding lipoprotein MlaA
MCVVNISRPDPASIEKEACIFKMGKRVIIKHRKIILRTQAVLKSLASSTGIFTFFLVICISMSFHCFCSVSSAKSYPQTHETFVSNEGQYLSNRKEIIEEDANMNMEYLEGYEQNEVPDPLAPFNKAMYHFNDKFYFWLLKPTARGYRAVFPEPARVGISNVFSNLGFPLRFVNCLLQANLKGAGIEISRFSINTTMGIGGLFDPARSLFKLPEKDEDFGQTFGVYGIKEGFYIMWPILGPSTIRDSVGMIGDYFSDPISYVKPLEASLGIDAYKKVNDTSLKIGDYEALKKAAIDPYIAIRDAYIQNRETKVKQK